ncbi:hypothetical protein [Vulcanococcus sp.]|uniref:hypothetical protein n=1 Tax=Vulcanococcus sp. TaxID=2856995 RepID=UPI003BFADC98
MKTRLLAPWRALQSSLRQLRRHPGPVLLFSACSGGLHLLGWLLFASAENRGSAVLNTAAHLLGLALYGGSLLWMIDGFTRAGLQLASGDAPRTASLFRWHGRCHWNLSLALLLLLALVSLILLSGFGVWSVLLLVLPALAPAAVVLASLACGALILSQLFLACWIVAGDLTPLGAVRRGWRLLAGHGVELLSLGAVVVLLSAGPLALGLLAEAVRAGLGIWITALALVFTLPLLATTVTNSFQGLRLRRSGR